MSEPAQSKPSPVALTEREIRSIFSGLVLIMFLGAIDQTIVGPALPTMGRSLGDFNSLSWIVTIYLLSSTAVTPLAGKLTDLYGRRSVISASVGIFMLGSLGSALAPNMLLMVIARGIQGLGGGGLITLAQTVIGDIVSARERGKYQAYISGMYAVAGLAGPTMGGFFAQYLSWRLIFWINIPLCVIAVYACDRVLKRLPRRSTQHKLDYAGTALLGCATISLLLVLSWGGHEFAWGSAVILTLLAASVLLGVLFVLHEGGAAEPIVPLTLLTNPVVRMTSSAGFLLMMSNVTLAIYVPLYFELYEGLPASQSGAMMIGLVLGGVIGSFSSGQYMRVSGHYRLPPRIGLAISGSCLVAVALSIGHVPVLGIIPMLTLVGIGNGLTFPVLTVSTQNAVQAKDLGVATAGQAFFRALGGMFGVSLFGALIVSLLPIHGGTKADLETLAGQGAAFAARAPQVRLAFQSLFAGCGCVVLTAWLFAWRIPEIPLRSKALHESESE